MPTTYTHDAFGRETYHRLPEEIKSIIRKYKKLYLIGLHGPDIFFYYRPYILKGNKVVELGQGMHRERARVFFEEGIRTCRETNSQALLAYLIGFVCHYILDSTCHPAVSRYMESTGLTHTEIETELDRYFMERDGKNPFFYHPASSIVPSEENARVIGRMFPLFDEKEILKTLKGMKYYCDLTVTESEAKRKLFHTLLKMVGADADLGKRIIEKTANPAARESTEELACLYKKALEEIVPAILNFYQAVMMAETLSERFDRDYSH